MTVRALARDDLVASVAAARAALAAEPAGTVETWVLPHGVVELTAALVIGVAGRSLTVRGGATTLALGAGAAVTGDAVAIDVVGADVRVEDVAVVLGATGHAVGVRVRATGTCALADVRCDRVSGASSTGLDVAAPAGSLVGVVVEDVVASAGDAVGIDLGPGLWSLSRARVTGTSATGTAVAVRARCTSLTAVSVTATSTTGTTALGLAVRASDELSLLDVQVEQVSATGAAVGASVTCAGDVAVRGLSARAVEGVGAAGAEVVVGHELDWLGGRVVGVRATSGGAVGVRVVAAPSRADVRLADLSVEEVSGTVPGASAAPADTWRDWLDLARAPLATGADLPALPASDDVAGVHVCAPGDEGAPWLGQGDHGPVVLTQCVLERVSGTAVQVVADLRDVEVRGLLAWTALRLGHVEGERVLLAQSTAHRVGVGLAFGPCSLTAACTLVTGVVTGPGVVLGEQTEVDDAVAVLTAGGLPPFAPAPDPHPYVDPGPAGLPPDMTAGALAPAAPHDLRLADPALHALAVRVPGDDDDSPVWLGALAPDVDGRCELRDPAPPPAAAVEGAPPGGPVVDYRARDARGLLALMTDRAQRVMPGWTPTGPADQTTMLLELVAERLDRLAYRQEVALSEAYLPTALTRRSVEDHARLVDHDADPGLSATTMVRFRLSADGAAELGLADELATRGHVVIGADTLVVNPDATDRLVVFGTEQDLLLVPALDSVRLADELELEPGAVSAVEQGDTEALLEGDLLGLEPGRWLVVVGVDPDDPERLDPDVPAHVVRVTRVDVGTDTTRVRWDPRRPAPTRYERATTRVLGNVVPAHHGVPLNPLTEQGALAPALERDDVLEPWRERLTTEVDGASGLREIPLPVDRVSVHAPGWPFPRDAHRPGVPQVALRVDGESWTRVDHLVEAGPGEDVFALRTGRDDVPSLRVGDGGAGNPLPARRVRLDLTVRVGLGTVGNVGVGALTRILALGPGGDGPGLVGDRGADRVALVRRLLTVTNPVQGVGGREPESIESIRYRAPLGVRDTLSAVVPADYERLVGELPDVAAVRAVVRDGALAPVVRMTVLLRDEDLLTGEQGAAERLRRWAQARERLEAVRLLGFDVELVPPRFVPLDLDVVVDVAGWAADSAERDVRAALDGPGGLFDPDVGGLGGDVRVDALTRSVLAVPGVRAVRVRRLRRLQQGAREHARTGVLPVEADEVAVLRHPYGGAFGQGLLTVGVCEVAG